MGYDYIPSILSRISSGGARKVEQISTLGGITYQMEVKPSVCSFGKLVLNLHLYGLIAAIFDPIILFKYQLLRI